jgi:radical SAM superfamily enzyme YgiQ (UPF0313 family)
MPPRPNLLLVNPWITDFTAFDFWLKPLGLLAIGGAARAMTGARLDLVDCLDAAHPALPRPPRRRPDGRGPFPKERIAKPAVLGPVPRRFSRYGLPVALVRDALRQVPRPDAVLITCTMTYWYPGVQTAVALVRETFGAVPVILGGVYATLCPEHARAESGADIVVSGPGERTLPDVLRDILGDGAVDASRAPDDEPLPAPAFDLLRDKRWLPLLTSRGCPDRCTFCASHLLYPGFRKRSLAVVLAEIEVALRAYGTRHFAFYDDALFVDRDRHIAPILEEIVRRKLDVAFHTPNGVHVREIDGPFAALLRRAGARTLFLSQESLDAELVAAKTPKLAEGDLERALAALEAAGYRRDEVGVYLLAGLPGQRAESVRESVRRVRGLGAVPRLSYFSPLPGTEEWAGLVRAGKLAAGADPLLHNKLAFPYFWGDISPDEFASLLDV